MFNGLRLAYRPVCGHLQALVTSVSASIWVLRLRQNWSELVETTGPTGRLNSEKSYITQSRQFQSYIKKCPEELSTDDVRNFLSYLAVERKGARATKNQAFNSLLFLIRHGLNNSVDDLDADRACL